MAKLKIAVDPTFPATVSIPLAGKAEPLQVGFVFKSMLRDELQMFVDKRSERTDEDTLNLIVHAWDFDEPVNAESIALLLQTYIGVAKPIVEKFLDEIAKARLGN